jgi:hypothetical protein
MAGDYECGIEPSGSIKPGEILDRTLHHGVSICEEGKEREREER